MNQTASRRWLLVAATFTVAALVGPFLGPRPPQPVVQHSSPTFQETPAQSLDSDFASALARLRAGDAASAISGFQRVVRRAPGMPEGHVNLGFALLHDGQYDAARNAFVRAVDLRRSQANAYYGLAVAQEGLGDLPGALGAMRTFVHLTPPGQPHIVKARSAIWEWQARLARARSGIKNASASHGATP